MDNNKPLNKKSSVNDYESALTEKIRLGDPMAFEELFKLYSEPLLNFALSYVKSPQPAEDIVQDVFVRIWTNRAKLDPQLPVKSYMYKSVLNQVFKYHRQLKMEQKGEEILLQSEENSVTPDQNLDKENVKTAIQQAMNELPEKCRNIFTMSRFHGLKYAEIAEITGVSVNTVKTQMGRAYKVLRKRLSVFLSIIFPY